MSFVAYYGRNLNDLYFDRRNSAVVGRMEEMILKEIARREKEEEEKKKEEEISKIREESQKLDNGYSNTIEKPLKCLSYIKYKKKKRKKRRVGTKGKPYIRSKAVIIDSVNPLVKGRWSKKKLVKNLDKVKSIITNNNVAKENILLLKAYSILVTPKTRTNYEKKRSSKVSRLPYKVPCFVCKKNEAYCNHHIHLLINGGLNKESNLIPICYSCHKKVHDWLA